MDRNLILIALFAFVVLAGCLDRITGVQQSLSSVFLVPGVGYISQPAASTALNVASNSFSDSTKVLTVWCTNSTGSYISTTLGMYYSNYVYNISGANLVNQTVRFSTYQTVNKSGVNMTSSVVNPYTYSNLTMVGTKTCTNSTTAIGTCANTSSLGAGNFTINESVAVGYAYNATVSITNTTLANSTNLSVIIYGGYFSTNTSQNVSVSLWNGTAFVKFANLTTNALGYTNITDKNRSLYAPSNVVTILFNHSDIANDTQIGIVLDYAAVIAIDNVIDTNPCGPFPDVWNVTSALVNVSAPLSLNTTMTNSNSSSLVYFVDDPTVRMINTTGDSYWSTLRYWNGSEFLKVNTTGKYQANGSLITSAINTTLCRNSTLAGPAAVTFTATNFTTTGTYHASAYANGSTECSAIHRLSMSSAQFGTVELTDSTGKVISTFYPGADTSYYQTMQTSGLSRVLPNMSLASDPVDITYTTARTLYVTGSNVSDVKFSMYYQYSPDASRWFNGTTALANLTNGSAVATMNDSGNFIRLVMFNGNSIPEYPYVTIEAR